MSNKKLWKTAIPAIIGKPFSCPKCGKYCGGFEEKTSSFIDKGETKFVEAPDPHYKWNELHKCSDCGTLYTVVNGT